MNDNERTIRSALVQAREFHENRDRMNAVLHLAPVRYSPLTERLREAVLQFDIEHLDFVKRP